MHDRHWCEPLGRLQERVPVRGPLITADAGAGRETPDPGMREDDDKEMSQEFLSKQGLLNGVHHCTALVVSRR